MIRQSDRLESAYVVFVLLLKVAFEMIKVCAALSAIPVSNQIEERINKNGPQNTS